jgi:hypothetical protein
LNKKDKILSYLKEIHINYIEFINKKDKKNNINMQNLLVFDNNSGVIFVSLLNPIGIVKAMSDSIT